MCWLSYCAIQLSEMTLKYDGRERTEIPTSVTSENAMKKAHCPQKGP